MKRSLLAASILGMALSGCGRSGSSDTGAASGNATENSATADAATIEATGSPGTIGANGAGLVPTPKFIEQAAISDMYEIEAAKIALARSGSKPVKAFAQQMITDHGATTAKLKTLLPASGVAATPPAALDVRHATMIEALQKVEAGKFDERYLDQQTTAHREALGLMDSYATHGDNPGLKSFAAETKPKIQMHLDMVSKLDHGGADEPGKATAKTGG